MPEFIKPNLILPVSLHDARLNGIEIKKDEILFVIEDGIRTIDAGKVEQTGKAFVFFPRLILIFVGFIVQGTITIEESMIFEILPVRCKKMG